MRIFTQVEEVLARVSKKGFQVNLVKSFWAKSEVEYLGFVITREGIRPQKKKIQGILSVKEPTSTKQLQSFIGMINFYKEMWRSRAEVLKSLTNKTGKGTKFRWTEEMQMAFDKIKTVIAEDVMLVYPDYNQTFHVHTHASKFQMGGVVSQNKTPVAFFSKKLNKAQLKYTVTEKELLSIVETLKQFKTMLYGQKVVVHTHHQNLTYDNSDHSSDRVLRQRLLLEEYGAKLKYIKGESNVVADALSRLPKTEENEEEIFYFWKENIPQNKTNKHELFENFFLNRRVYEDQTICPISFKQMHQHQKKDVYIQNLRTRGDYSHKWFGKI